MTVYEGKDVRGIIVAGKVYCHNCMGLAESGEKVTILTDEIDDEDKIYICDECHEKL